MNRTVRVTHPVLQFEITGLEQAAAHGGGQRCPVIRMHVLQKFSRAQAARASLRIDAVERGYGLVIKETVVAGIVGPNADAAHSK